MEPPSDADLIEACLRGDGAAFAVLIERHGVVAQTIIRSSIRDLTEVEDVLQRTLMDAWLSLSRLRDPGRFRPWLAQIARRRCRDALATARRRPELAEPSTLEARLDRLGHRVVRAIDPAEVHDALRATPARARQAAALFYLQGLSIPQIARQLGCPQGTVKRRLFDARIFLRGRLGIPMTASPIPSSGDWSMDPAKAHTRRRPNLPASLPPIEVAPLAGPGIAEITTPELLWWHIVPQVGQWACLGTYEPPDWQLVHYNELRVTVHARVHRQDAVVIELSDWRPQTGWVPDSGTCFARLSAAASEYLAVDLRGGERELYTFLDEGFETFWGSQPRRYRDTGRCHGDAERLVIVEELTGEAVPAGSWRVQAGDRVFECMRLLVIDTPLEDPGSLLVEAYLTREGRTVLQRHYAQQGALREGELVARGSLRRTINDVPFVHWYDQLTGMTVGL